MAVFLILLLLLTGCTSTWRAPVSSYPDSNPVKEKQNRNSAPIKSKFYKVRAGDTLYAIAWRTGRDFKDLARWNQLGSPYIIYVGQVIRTIPPVKKKKVVKKKPSNIPKKQTANIKKTKVKAKQAPDKFKQSLYWKWPYNGRIIKGFKKGDDTSKGIVVSGKLGQSILSAEAGKVVYSGSGLIGYGQLIIIKHNNNYLSAYGHNRKILVREGEWITKGKKIAEMGINETGVPALHFEIRKNGNPINPVSVLPRRN